MKLLTGLTLVFVIAKLLKIITWSWWFVFAPTIAQIIFGILILVLGTSLAVLSEATPKRKYRK
jgi:hypothetical protein